MVMVLRLPVVVLVVVLRWALGFLEVCFEILGSRDEYLRWSWRCDSALLHWNGYP